MAAGGLAFDHRVWRHQVAALRPYFQVICPDLLGFGRSSEITGPFSHSETLERLITALGLSKVHIVGHSLGGRIAGEFVQPYPERSASLTLAAADLGGVPLRTLGPIIRKVFELGRVDIAAAKREFVQLEVFDVLREHEDFNAIADEVTRRVPGAQRRVIPGAGHVPNLEAPERFSAELLEFLKSAG